MNSRVSPLIAPKRPRPAQSRLDAVRMATSGPTRESASSRDDQQEGAATRDTGMPIMSPM